ncbi:MAG: hypothetical protein ACLQFW_25700, partial [Xanthobacteraceae bacterium]
MDKLYHSTLARNVQSIMTIGLLPKKGLWTADFHWDAKELVYAADENHRGSLIVVVAGQMAKSRLVQWSDHYQFGHFSNDLNKRGAIIVVRRATFRHYPDHFEHGHPSGTEPGNWYSREPIGTEHIQGIMTGREMLN